jgi:hypothetical protein
MFHNFHFCKNGRNVRKVSDDEQTTLGFMIIKLFIKEITPYLFSRIAAFYDHSHALTDISLSLFEK